MSGEFKTREEAIAWRDKMFPPPMARKYGDLIAAIESMTPAELRIVQETLNKLSTSLRDLNERFLKGDPLK